MVSFVQSFKPIHSATVFKTLTFTLTCCMVEQILQNYLCKLLPDCWYGNYLHFYEMVFCKLLRP